MPTNWTDETSGTTPFVDPSTTAGKGFGKTPFGSPVGVATRGFGDPSSGTPAWTDTTSTPTVWTDG